MASGTPLNFSRFLYLFFIVFFSVILFFDSKLIILLCNFVFSLYNFLIVFFDNSLSKLLFLLSMIFTLLTDLKILSLIRY